MTAHTRFPALSAGEIEAFHRDGYVLRKGLLSPEEVAALNAAVPDLPRKGRLRIDMPGNARLIDRAGCPFDGPRPFAKPQSVA